MPNLEEPIWPVSVNVVRTTLDRSGIPTLHKPEIAIVARSNDYGWARYAVCVSRLVYNRYPDVRSLAWCFTYAFCEPVSDLTVEEINEGMLLSFTIYVSKEAGMLRKNELSTDWALWSKKFKD